MVKQITLTTDKRLEHYLDVDDDINGLIYLEDETPTNILLFKSIFDTLVKSSPHNLTLGISEKFINYVELFKSKNVECKVNIKAKSYDYVFLVPNGDLTSKKKKNTIRDLNRKFIGLTNVRFSPAEVSVDSVNENSDSVLVDMDKRNKNYSTIVDEVDSRGLELVHVNDTNKINSKVDNKDLDLLDVTSKSVSISGNGFIPFDTEFSIKGTDTVEGKVYPQASSVLKYVNKNAKKNDDVSYDITGKGVVEYEFKVNVLSNALSIEIYLDDFNIRSGISNLEVDCDDTELALTDVDITESLITSNVFMGESGANLLLAYSILGISKCVLLTDGDKNDDYFKNDNCIDITNYKSPTAGDLLEDMYTSEI